MSESSRQIHWVSQARGRPILYVMLSVPAVAVFTTAYAFACMSFSPDVGKWAFFGVFLIFFCWAMWQHVVLTGPDTSRPAKVEAAVRRLGLEFATRPTSNELALPLDFPLAQASARWSLPGRRGPRNLAYGEVGARRVVVFDIAYPLGGIDFTFGGRGETTAVYFPGPVSGLPDWPVGGNLYNLGFRMRPPEPFASALAAHPIWAVECRGGQLVVYRPYHLCDPETYSEFITAAAQVYSDVVTTASGKLVRGDVG
jgi:hypothetical protein